MTLILQMRKIDMGLHDSPETQNWSEGRIQTPKMGSGACHLSKTLSSVRNAGKCLLCVINVPVLRKCGLKKTVITHVCVGGVCICTCSCMQVHFRYMQRSQKDASTSSIFLYDLHTTFWDWVSHWIWSLTIWLDWLDSFRVPPVSTSPPLGMELFFRRLCIHTAVHRIWYQMKLKY